MRGERGKRGRAARVFNGKRWRFALMGPLKSGLLRIARQLAAV